MILSPHLETIGLRIAVWLTTYVQNKNVRTVI